MSSDNIKNMNDVYTFMHKGISSVVGISNDLLSLSKESNMDDVLNLLSEMFKTLDYFDSFAFYKIIDLIDFEQAICFPESEKENIADDVEEHITNGTFAWALNNINPVVVRGAVSKHNQVLFSLSTKRRIHGMFIANAKDNNEINGVMLDILQLILSTAVFSIDNLKLTEQLTEYTVSLEDKVKERTKELEDALVRVEASSKARSEFLANISHEIRTPMNGVLGMMDLLKATNLDDKQRHYVSTAKNSGNNMLVILNDILDLSKVESGKLVIEDEEFNLMDTICDISSMFTMELHEKGVELIISVDPLIPCHLLGGQTRFWQIIMNLLGNAKKFTETGEIILSLTLKDLTENEVDIFVSIKDSGIGIAKESQGKIFESFEQAEINTSRHFGGTGLGLTLCQKLTKMMGGEIGVTSVLGEGSDFYFNVKMKRALKTPKMFNLESLVDYESVYMCNNEKYYEAINNAFEALAIKNKICSTQKEAVEIISSMRRDGSKCLFVDEYLLTDSTFDIEEIKNNAIKPAVCIVCHEVNKDKYVEHFSVMTKPFIVNNLYEYLTGDTGDNKINSKQPLKNISASVLVVEDNKVNQMVVNGMLDNVGCQVTIAENGRVALDLLAKSEFDIVFMDINMPVMNGCDATMKYRSIESNKKHMPIIALTANVLPEYIDSFYEAGMDDYMPKPLSVNRLNEILIKWIPNAKVPSSNNENMDIDLINNVKNLMGDGYKNLVETYLSRSEELVNDIFNNHDNIEKLTRDIHSLKGSSGSMGAKKMFTLCESFEHLLRKGRVSSRDEVIKNITAELQSVHAFLLN